MKYAKVFQSGNSQAVRLPKEFRIASLEVQIFRKGDDIVLRENRKTLAEALAELPPLPNDFELELPEDRPPQERDLGL